MDILKLNLKRNAFSIFSCVLIISLCFSCTKEIENKDDENTVIENEQEVTVKDGDLLQLSISSEMNVDTKAHWDDVNGVGIAQFEWDETTDENADMVVCANKDSYHVNQNVGGYLSYWKKGTKLNWFSMAKVKPNASTNKLADITTLYELYFESNVGQKVYCVAPVNEKDVSRTQKELTVNLLMPYRFDNSGSKNLKNFKEYSYICAETTIDKVVKANNTSVIFGQCKASFKAIPAVFRLSVTNSTSGNIIIDEIYAKALKDKKETKIFPNMLVYKVDGNGLSIKESENASASDSYYSTLVADLSSSSEVIPANKNGFYYMFVLPRDEKDSYKGVELEFTVWATVDGVERNFKITKNLDALKAINDRGINFNSGYIYTFKLDLNSANISTEVVRHADGEVSVMQESEKTKFSRIIITGDGYDAKDLRVGGTFDRDAKDALEAIFSIEPFASYRDYFKVYCLYAESQERGVSGYTTYNSSSVEEKNTKYKVRYDDPMSSLMSFNYTIGKEFFKKVEGYNFSEYPNTTSVLILVNNSRYAGTCWSWPHAFAVALCPMNREPNSAYVRPCINYKNIIYHEFNGHAYGRLADEYYSGKENVNISTDSTRLAKLKESQSDGGCLNVTLESDPTKAPWAAFMNDKTKYERVGMVQGGYYYGLGVWRCEDLNCMIDNRAYFSAYCRYLQYERIMKTFGITTCSIESFMLIDNGANVDPVATTQNFVEQVEVYPPLGEPVYLDYNE